MKVKNFNFNIILLCISILSLITTILFTSMYYTTKNIIEEKLGASAQNIATATSVSIMENISDYKNFLVNRDVNSSYYQNMQRKLSSIKGGSNVKYIYTFNSIDDNTIEYILSSESNDDLNFYTIGNIREINEVVKKVYKFKRSYYFKYVDYHDGDDYTVAYAPIFDEDNNIVGILGAAVEQGLLFESFNRLIITMLTTYAILLVVIIALLRKLVPFLTEPMHKDKLTNAYNKRYFEDIIKDKVDGLIKNHSHVAVMMLDLDHFKSINDTYGHPFGDIVLADVANTIRCNLRSDDYFIRYGGEEFMLILPLTNKHTILEIAERIRRIVEKKAIFNEEKQIDINVTISIGIAFSNKTHKSINELIEEADKALYDAKIKRNDISEYKKKK